MTTRVDKVISQNPGKFSSLNQLSVLAPCDSGASTAQDPVTASCDIEKILVTSPCVTTQPASDIRSDNCIVPTSSVADEQLEDPLPDNTEIAGQPVTANESDNVSCHFMETRLFALHFFEYYENTSKCHVFIYD